MPWRVEIAGDVNELIELARAVQHSQPSILHMGGSRAVVVSEQLALVRDKRTAKATAARLVHRLAGVARLVLDDSEASYRVTSIESVADAIAPPEPRIVRPKHLGGIATIEGDALAGSCRPNEWLELAEQDELVARVLELLGGGIWWDEVSELISLIQSDVGGEARLVELGWISSREHARVEAGVRQFGSKRVRSRSKPQPSITPLTSRGLERLVMHLVWRWLYWRRDRA